MLNCKKDCPSCPVYLHGKCYLDHYNNTAEVKQAEPVSLKKGGAMRWFTTDWDGRAEGVRSPELMTNLEPLPNNFDRMLEESADFFVIATEEPGNGASLLTRIVKKREGERLHHPLQDMEDPDEENESEDVMDHAIIVPMSDEGEPIQDYEPGPTVPAESWDLVFETVYKPWPVDADTEEPLELEKYYKLKEEHNGDLRGIVKFKMLPFEASTPQYFMPKFRNHQPTPEVKRLLKAIVDGRINTPILMFKAMNKLKDMMSNKHKNLNEALPEFRQRKSNQVMKKVMGAHKEHMDDAASQVYNPDTLFFMFAKRLWDFFHRVYQLRDPKGYNAWIARKKERALKAKLKENRGANNPPAPQSQEFGDGYYVSLDEMADMMMSELSE